MTRTLTRDLVAWCPECLWFYPLDEAGTSCAGEEHNTRTGFRLLRKRRMWLCSDCARCFQDRQSAEEHECGEFD